MTCGVFLYGQDHPSRSLLIDRRPLADGGDGTLDILHAQGWGALRTAEVRNARGTTISARWLWRTCDRTALIEMSEAAGLRRLATDLKPWLSNTYGVGQLIAAALNHKPRRIYISLGGSATIDGGAGALAALGAIFLDRHGRDVSPLPAHLEQVADLDCREPLRRLGGVELCFLADVTTPLAGCVHTYGPQKGVRDLDRFEGMFASWLNLLDVNQLREAAMWGAAGGFAAAFAAHPQCQIQLGLPFIATAVGFAESLRLADCVLTGEGVFDSSSLEGKVPGWVWHHAGLQGVPCGIVTGRTDGFVDSTIEANLIWLQEPDETPATTMAHTPARMPTMVAQWLNRHFP